MTLLKAIKNEAAGNGSLERQLIESANEYGFDLNHEYPENLKLVDTGEDSSLLEGDEYIEDSAGIAYKLNYEID